MESKNLDVSTVLRLSVPKCSKPTKKGGLKPPDFRVFDCDDVSRGGDNAHFTTAGRMEMGKRCAAAMIELLDEKVKGDDD